MEKLRLELKLSIGWVTCKTSYSYSKQASTAIGWTTRYQNVFHHELHEVPSSYALKAVTGEGVRLDPDIPSALSRVFLKVQIEPNLQN